MVGRTRERGGDLTAFSSTYNEHVRYKSSRSEWETNTTRGTPVGYHGFIETMSDVVGNPNGDNPLSHVRFKGRPARVIGETTWVSGNGLYTHTYTHSNTGIGFPGYKDPRGGHLSTSASPYPIDYLNRAINAGSPGSSDVDLGEFLGELRDLPRTVFPKRLRHIPIAVLFGVLPILSDLESLLGLTESIDARLKYVNGLVGKEKKKKSGLGSASADRIQDLGSIHGHTAKLHKRTTVRAWSVKTHTIEYNKLKPPPTWGRDDMRRLLLSDTPLLTAWNLMPWSWLIDYFFNIAHMIEASNNKIPGYSISKIVICVSTKTEGTAKLSHVNDRYTAGLRLHGGTLERVNQRRSVFPDPSATFPRFHSILSNRQIGNLLALGLAMSKR